MDVLCEQYQDEDKSWTMLDPTVCHYVPYSSLKTQKDHARVSTVQEIALQSSDLWLQSIHLCSRLAMHHTWDWFVPRHTCSEFMEGDEIYAKNYRIRTLSQSLRLFICSLKSEMISSRVCFQFGILTPRVARDATWIMFWKDGCSKAETGCSMHE